MRRWPRGKEASPYKESGLFIGTLLVVTLVALKCRHPLSAGSSVSRILDDHRLRLQGWRAWRAWRAWRWLKSTEKASGGVEMMVSCMFDSMLIKKKVEGVSDCDSS